MQLWIGLDADGFVARAGSFVAETIERNVLATVLDAVQAGRYREAVFAVASDAAGVTAGVAFRTPPHALLAAGHFDEPRAFWDAWLGIDPETAGVSAETDLARSLARAWAEQTGGRVELGVSEALYVLERVIAPQPAASGQLRLAGFRDRAQLAGWAAAFAVDAGRPHVEAIVAGVQHSIEQERFYVWDLTGQTVAMIGHAVVVGGVARVGPVYTPGTATRRPPPRP
jgi:hypothetical protein